MSACQRALGTAELLEAILGEYHIGTDKDLGDSLTGLSVRLVNRTWFLVSSALLFKDCGKTKLDLIRGLVENGFRDYGPFVKCITLSVGGIEHASAFNLSGLQHIALYNSISVFAGNGQIVDRELQVAVSGSELAKLLKNSTRLESISIQGELTGLHTLVTILRSTSPLSTFEFDISVSEFDRIDTLDKVLRMLSPDLNYGRAMVKELRANTSFNAPGIAGILSRNRYVLPVVTRYTLSCQKIVIVEPEFLELNQPLMNSLTSFRFSCNLFQADVPKSLSQLLQWSSYRLKNLVIEATNGPESIGIHDAWIDQMVTYTPTLQKFQLVVNSREPCLSWRSLKSLKRLDQLEYLGISNKLFRGDIVGIHFDRTWYKESAHRLKEYIEQGKMMPDGKTFKLLPDCSYLDDTDSAVWFTNVSVLIGGIPQDQVQHERFKHHFPNLHTLNYDYILEK